MHPVLFDIFGYEIRTYSVAMAVGFIVGMILIRRRAPLERVDVDIALGAAISTIFGTILGGRALYIITTWQDKFAGKPWYEIFKVWQGGLVFYGGFLGSIVAVLIYLRFRRQNLWPILDLLAPYVGLGLAIHRPFGCFMNGCCFGGPTELPWGVHFPPEAAATKIYGVGQAVHPTQVYMGLNGLILFLVLSWYRNRKVKQGEVFALLLAIYAVNRFIIEIFRGDLVRGFVPQKGLIGLAIFLAGLGLYLLSRVKKIRPAQIASWLLIAGGVAWAFFGLSSDAAEETAQVTPFSTSQFIGFYVFAAGMVLFARARWFGELRPPDFGRPVVATAAAPDQRAGGEPRPAS